MPTYPNVHAYLDNSELHPPKDFVLAANDTFLGKDPLGQLNWFDTYWQRPVNALLDGSLTPPAAQHGDRYVLLGMDTTAVCGTAMVQVFITTTVDGTAISTTALQQQNVYGVCAHAGWDGAELNSIVEYFANDHDGNTVEQWMNVTPLEGFTLRDLSDGGTWYFDDDAWVEQEAGTVPDVSLAESHTYTEMQSLVASSSLQKGMKYWISDRSILIEATDVNRLSLDGDHTREIKAYGWLELTGGVSGSVDDITAEGTSLLSSPVSFNTDLQTTAADVVTAINAGAHDYAARQGGTRIILLAPAGMGVAANGNVVNASTTDITFTVADFTNGQDVGQNWFRIRYVFDSDAIIMMSDRRGNSVFVPEQLVLDAPNAIDEFPWGYGNVNANTVFGGLLTAYSATGNVNANRIVFTTTLNANGFSGVRCIANDLTYFCSLDVTQATGNITGNVFTNAGSLIAAGASGSITYNRIDHAVITANGFAGTDCSGNQFSGGSVDISNATCSQLNRNTINGSTFTATGASGDITGNVLFGSDVDLSNYTGDQFINNQLNHSTLTAQNASGNIDSNILNQGTIEADGASGGIIANIVNGYSEIHANGYLTNRIIGCELYGQSVLEANSNSFDIGRVRLYDISELDLNGLDEAVYLVCIRTPGETIKSLSGLINTDICLEKSNYMANATVDSSGAVSFDQDYIRFAGILNVVNSGVLTTVNGLSKAPVEFIIKPDVDTILSLDSGSVENIKIPIGIATISLDGNKDDFIKLRKNMNNDFILITEVNNF